MVNVDSRLWNKPASENYDRPMTLHVRELLSEVGSGKMSALAYDTAWVARLGEIDSELSDRALAWLREHQLPDGSWGAAYPYYHDRLISTLAAIIALARQDGNQAHRSQIDHGLLALERITNGVTQQLHSDPNGPTIGFEMIVPTLVAEAESIGLIRHQGARILNELSEHRKRKLKLLSGKKISRYITTAFSAEMAGEDGLATLDVENLQEENGSVGCSPSATAYFNLRVRKDDRKALHYLRQACGPDGGIPNVAFIDTFETAWTLWNLSLIPGHEDLPAEFDIRRHVDFLSRAWDKHNGAGFSSEYSVNDGDETAVVYDTLLRYGVTKNLDGILGYEEDGWFRCFDLESDPSMSANVHVLGALRQAGFDKDSPPIRKILRFLETRRSDQGYWKDKWHTSAYYTTSHAVIACAGFADATVRSAVEWILQTQNADGSWGRPFPTAEETAYCIQALEIWQRHSGHISREVIGKAANWLEENSDPPYAPLWIGKGLYSPELVIRSAVLSALLLSGKG